MHRKQIVPKIITTTSTIQLYNWHNINLFSSGNLWSRHETSSKLWHRPTRSRTTKTDSLTVTLFNCANVVATFCCHCSLITKQHSTKMLWPKLKMWYGKMPLCAVPATKLVHICRVCRIGTSATAVITNNNIQCCGKVAKIIWRHAVNISTIRCFQNSNYAILD